ncbi:MAG TPA: IS5 family transposase [Burkholderiaceae bacterium]|jgi:IS5 family transposase|nr:IS5 family transposase [Burkholderiaceae bacterium]
MQPKRESQPTFFDLAVQQRGGSNRILETIAREVDFSQAEALVAATYGQGGRPACRVGVLLRVMILQHLYGLSDPQAEEQLKDRLSFQKFVQLDTHETVPDETTICRFRQRLIECRLHERLLDLLNGQLEARGYIVKRTTLVDATLIESSRKRPDAQMARTGQAPDADARYTHKYSKSYYGYKAHVSSDGEHQLIRIAVISPANANDADWLERVAPPDATSLYADKAYDTKANDAWLQAQGIENQIIKKGAHHIKLTEQDQQDNRRKSLVRRCIERIFGHWKQWQHYRRARYLGLARNQLELMLKAVAYNLKRLAGILNQART